MMASKFSKIGRKAVAALVLGLLVGLPLIAFPQGDANGPDRKARVEAWERKVKAINRDNRGRVNEYCRSVPREVAARVPPGTS